MCFDNTLRYREPQPRSLPDRLGCEKRVKDETDRLGRNATTRICNGQADLDIIESARITEPLGFIVKPFQDRELKFAVEMALYKAKMEKELKASRESFHNIVEKSADGIIVVGNDGVVWFVNRTAETFFGRKEKELVGEMFGFPVQTGGVLEVNVFCQGRESGIAEMRVVETQWNGQPAWLAMLRDITQRKETEEKLKDAVKMKSEFTSMVSHELRTPLTAIKEGIRLVIQEHTGALNDEQKEFLGIAKRNVDRLARLIDDILDFHKLESGKMEIYMHKNDMNEVAKEIKEAMTLLAHEKGLNLLTQLDETIPRVDFDKDKITQVLTNIVHNAVKFTEQGSVTIATTKGDNIIQVSVSDTGPGIKKEDLPKLFNEFEQLAGGSKRKTGGSGLGLAISRKIIEKHNGKVWAESRFGEGTIFHFILPIKERRGEGKQ